MKEERIGRLVGKQEAKLVEKRWEKWGGKLIGNHEAQIEEMESTIRGGCKC